MAADAEGGPTVPADPAAGLRARVARMFTYHWRPHGYTAPNLSVYPWQWLWDSCFCCLVWAELGDVERALTELDRVFSVQDPSGFVPHMNYVADPEASVAFWGRRGSSCITQPPMWGHAIAELHRRGVVASDELLARAVAGLRFLLERRARIDGLPVLCHPWESGTDDSPRWDAWCPGGSFDTARWRTQKGVLVRSIEQVDGAPVRNPAFAVASVGFGALVAFNVAELESVTGAGSVGDGRELVDALDACWDDERSTWVDRTTDARDSATTRTADALLATLVTSRPGHRTAAFAELACAEAFAGAFGPRGVDERESVFRPDRYWRGPVWPQLAYLLWLAASRAGATGLASELADATVRGAAASGLAEYWHPDTGAGLGATPQSWTGLALLMT